jgi:Flp pilus assembly protein TadG
MNPPATSKFRNTGCSRHSERGVTMVLVALAMVAIIAMAALSIDVITLYLAREEAQRSADGAALAAARVISLSGMTGDPANSASSWQAICGGSSSPATKTATAVATQSAVGGAAATVTVTYSAGGRIGADCSSLRAAFGVNPVVTVQLSRASLPTFFSRIWGNTGNSISATATAEAFNPSKSSSVGNQPTGSVIPVQPSCVKPWLVPNHDPVHPAHVGTNYCDQNNPPGPCDTLVSTTDGSITHPGISLDGSGASGVIGERFWLVPDCMNSPSSCSTRNSPAIANHVARSRIQPPPSLEYLPGQILNPASAVPACAGATDFERAIAGCDQSTVHQCGVVWSSSASPNMIDLSENPTRSGHTTEAVECLINQGNSGTGQDQLISNSYPFQILAGDSNPLVSTGLAADSIMTSSSSVVSLPIYDDNSGSTVTINPYPTLTAVTVVGYLQVFINAVDRYGNVDVTILNVAGCSNNVTAGTNGVNGSSPVPIRLITPP